MIMQMRERERERGEIKRHAWKQKILMPSNSITFQLCKSGTSHWSVKLLGILAQRESVCAREREVKIETEPTGTLDVFVCNIF